MNRRHFLLTSASGAAAWSAASLPTLLKPLTANGAVPPKVVSRWVPSTNIRDYLILAAKRITDHPQMEGVSAKAWLAKAPEKRKQFFEMMGLDGWWTEVRPPPPVTVTGVVEREHYRIEKLYYESTPGLLVTGNLYIPKKIDQRTAAVLYVCGHAKDQKVYYQAHARRFAELGFICLVAETIEALESEGYHHGCYREGWWHWYSRGYASGGIELLNGIRGLDLLASRSDVDPERLGVTGISGGGAASWWIGAADPRAKVVAPVCGTATLYSHLQDRTIDGHCDCMWWNNFYGWDLADVGALIAPRPLLIGSADKDEIFTIESIRRVHQQLHPLYHKFGATDRLRLVETPGGHSYHERSRTEIFSWFTKHLMGRDVPSSKIGDIDTRPESQETSETLRVFIHGAPGGNHVRTIQDEFIVLPSAPNIPDASAAARERERVVRELLRTTFAAFPAHPPTLNLQIEQEFEEAMSGERFSFSSEEGWRLRGQRFLRKPTPASPHPAVIALRSPGEGRWDTRSFISRLPATHAGIAMETRGIGDTAWSEELNWHLRRAAAWTGRTLASMRVWDTLRAIQATRQLPGVDPGAVSLAARGELCAVALYAALLDGKIRSLILEAPPATQNTPGQKDGRGPAIEMLNCLRITDLPQVAGLLWPTELVLIGEIPSSYSWTDSLYQRLGKPGRSTRVADIRDWKPI